MSESINNFAHLGAVEAQALIKTGEISPVELMEACIAQTEALDPAVNAMVTRAFDPARKAAKQAEQKVRKGESLGVLHGIPVAIKDIQDTKDIITTYGSKQLASNLPAQDAGIVARVRSAGGIIIGKTNVPEMSIGANTVNPLFGATGNAFNTDLTCGGSSGGSGVAVATHMAPLATGSDHGGSLRIPACYSGVVGYRATPGLVPNEQRTCTQSYYSVQGPMARSVADAALLLSAISERNLSASLDPMVFPANTEQFCRLDEVDVHGLRVAVSADLGGVLVSDAVRSLFKQRVEKIRRLVGTCDWHPVDLRAAAGVDWHLRQDLFVGQYHQVADGWGPEFNENIRATYQSALTTPMADIARARRTQMDLFRSVNAVFDDYDLLICPGVSVPPFAWKTMNPEKIDGKPVKNYMAWLSLTASITVVGHPVLALPCGLDDSGLPFGIQVIGRMYADHALLSAAQSLEQAFAKDAELARPSPDFEALKSVVPLKGRNVDG